MIKPVYRAKADIFQLNLDFDLTDELAISSQTVYNTDRVYATQDYNRYTTVPVFGDSSLSTDFFDLPTGYNVTRFSPNGVFCDPQVGCSDTIVGMDLSRAKSEQFTQEFRIQSAFSGPVNYSGGLTYTKYETLEDYYVFSNGVTMASIMVNTALPAIGSHALDRYTINPDCVSNGGLLGPDYPDSLICIPIESNPISDLQDTGHNYFLSRNPYKMESKAVFGEAYWQATDGIKLTAGLRYTDDTKATTPIPSETLLTEVSRLDRLAPIFGEEQIELVKALAVFSFGSGAYPALPEEKRQWKEVTGRFVVDWHPELSFTNDTMVYASYSRGYKGGGLNPPPVGLNYEAAAAAGILLPASAPPEFRPEFVNAFEIGTKNALIDGALILNASAFYYDYKDYQVSKIVDRSAQNENFDAEVWGLELETVFHLSRNLRVNAALGYLDTKLAEGSQSIDVMNHTAGRSDWVTLKPSITLFSNCIAPAAVARKVLIGEPGAQEATLRGLCPGVSLDTGAAGVFNGGTTFLYDGTTYNPREQPEANYGAGFFTDVSGNELPNSPHFTVSLGGQYSVDFLDDWRATIRGDFYWQSQQWARIYELPIDKLHAWKNGNLRVTFERPDDGLEIELYAKNIFDDTPITDTFTNSDDSALTTNIFVLDPRILGLSIKKTF